MISLFKTTKIISVKLIDRKESVMKKNIHPEYKFVVFEDTSTLFNGIIGSLCLHFKFVFLPFGDNIVGIDGL